ncbi:auxilin-like protein 1 [Ipomoea triloba]|uniref:auxilin-like protein 1 n=1 Tax=Ipomoea triloba TaxID=35885 RepID=UPI00125DAD80|nr:auxilin-like protein 1 [Ipomoea triloba]
MENLSHSFSKRSYHGNGFTTKTSKSLYDDVFGGPPKLGVPTLSPRLEDYTEIFGGFHSSRTSSIPILDLPAVDDHDEELSLDVRSSQFDYSEIFGGFNVVDFALSYEDLVRQSSAGYNSSDEAWSPAQSESLSDDSDPSAFSERSQSMPYADIHYSINDDKQFNVSYHGPNERTDVDGSDVMTDMSRLQAASGYTYVIPENQSSRNTEDGKAPIEATIDVSQGMSFGGSISEENRFKKSASHFTNTSFGVCGDDPEPTKLPFCSVTDISLRTKPSQLPPPSRPPPAFAETSQSNRPNSRLHTSKNYACERIPGEAPLPFFAAEVDASSSTEMIKDAMAKAQAKVRSAKESMEKKKQDLKSCKQRLQSNTMEGITSRTFDEPAHHEDNRVPGKCEKEAGQHEPFSEESKIVKKTNKVELDLSEGGNSINFAGKSSENKQEEGYSQGAHKTDRTVAWREAMEFFEVTETFLPQDASQKLKYEMKHMDSHEHQQPIRAAADAFGQHENCKTFRPAKGAPEWEEDRKQLKMTKVAFELGEECGRSGKVDQDPFELDLNLGESQQQGQISGLNNNGYKHDVVPSESEQNMDKFRAKPKPNHDCDRFDNEKSVMDADARKVNGKEPKMDLEKEEYEGRHNASVDKISNENILKHGLEQEKRDEQQEGDSGGKEKNVEQEALEINKNGNSIKESLWEEDVEQEIKWESKMNDKILKMDLEQEDNKGHKEVASNREDHDKIRDAFKWEHGCKQFPTVFPKNEPEEKNQDHEREECRVGPCNSCEGNGGGVRITKFQEQEHDELRTATTSEVEVDNISEEADELDDIDWIIEDHCKLEELSEQAKNNEAIWMDGKNAATFDRAYESSFDEKVDVSQMSEKLDRSFKKLEETEAAFMHDNEKIKAEHEDGEEEAEVGVNNLPVEERFISSSEKQDNSQRKDVRNPPSLDGHLTNSQEIGIGIGKLHVEKENLASQMACHSENVKATTFEGQKGNSNGGLQFPINKEVTKEKFSRQVVRNWSDNGRKIGEALSAVLEDGETPSQTDQRSTNKSTGREEIMSNEGRIPKELKVERQAREQELEGEYLKKIEEEREREREREKDRMAVTGDALEKLYAQARERSERAAVDRAATEVGQKATVDNRGRLEKPFMDAREKYLAEKASAEARLRAERAAVERATAEARQRAFEKAMAGKAANDAREQVERSYSDRFSGSTEMRTRSFSSNIPDQQNPQPSKLRYSYSSANAGIEGESPQRCKARIERYQRTAERAAKALAEKNMRDLLAQREQAERNRLAEALDGEVKRWSSGKEGNLRALLSTLQYILGPDSGWQPVPLTEVITSAAVKKAYRKATLCVHPDKLQQRGATIQQKYICEKVFDLLKEAWNKFNSEER